MCFLNFYTLVFWTPLMSTSLSFPHRHHVEERTWRSRWSQVQDLTGFPCWGRHELCRQHRSKELVRDRSLWDSRKVEQIACGVQWRHGFGLCEEGEARVEEKGDACCNHPAKEDLQKKGRTVHLL